MKHLITTTLISLTLITGLIVIACGDDSGMPDPNAAGVQCQPLANAPTLAADWVSFVNWDEAEEVLIQAHEVGEDNFHYMWDKKQLVAGKPYILVMESVDTNTEKHYFHMPEFFQAIATRKLETAYAEYKAPYFSDVELQLNGRAELYFVPVVPGDYTVYCSIPGHRDSGMEDTVSVVCGQDLSLDLGVSPDFDPAMVDDDRRSGDHLVWDTVEEVEIKFVEHSMEEGSEDLAYDVPELRLRKNQAYKLKLSNDAGNAAKHYYTAPEFFMSAVTRKAEDGRAEVKVPYFNAVEVLIGGSTELFVVPTEAGEFEVKCTQKDHETFGMKGKIIVEE